MKLQLIVLSVLLAAVVSHAKPSGETSKLTIREAFKVVREFNRDIQELEEDLYEKLDKRDAVVMDVENCSFGQRCKDPKQCNMVFVAFVTGTCESCVRQNMRCSSRENSQKTICCPGLTCKENNDGWTGCM